MIPGDSSEKCFICGRWHPEHVHHCLHGSRRKMADKYGLTVHLCTACHTALHDKGEHDRELEAIAQKAFENNYGHEEWMRIFRKNYTEERHESSHFDGQADA